MNDICIENIVNHLHFDETIILFSARYSTKLYIMNIKLIALI